MREELEKLLQNSYSPYSNFKVASIVITKDDNKFYGVNVENASFGGTICAERNAINAAITAGYKANDFKEIYIMTEAEKLTFPCFICRQTMVEFFGANTKVILMNQSKEEIYNLSDITSHSFSKEDLN